MTPDHRDALVHRVRLAFERTDAPTLATLLSSDVVALIDGGGDVITSTQPITGADVVPHLFTTLADAALTVQQVNGVCAVVARRADRVVAIVSFGFDDESVTRLWITVSPLKLQRWN